MAARPGSDLSISGIIFDLDGVLIDGMQFHIEAWHYALAGRVDQIDDTTLYLLEGLPSRSVVDRLARDLDLGWDVATKELIVRTKRDHYKAIFRVDPMQGAKELLDWVIESGFSIAIVTGTSGASAELALSHFGLAEVSIPVISSDDEIPGKPDPAPFFAASELMSLPTNRLLVIENAPPGISGAIDAGIYCCAIASYLDPSYLRDADQVFGDLAELKTWLMEIVQVSREG